MKVESNVLGREHRRFMQGMTKHSLLATARQYSPFEHFAFC